MYSLAALCVVPFITTVLYNLTSNAISKFLWNKHSILKDIHLLSKARPKDRRIPGTAIICGGSIGGLFVARVCANHFEKVLIVEPEEWVAQEDQGLEDHQRDPDPPKRARVAQYTAFHHFQLFLILAMKEMFSNLEEAVLRVGGRLVLNHENFWISGVPLCTPSGFPHYAGGTYPRLISLSRPAFETTLRRLVLQTCPEVQYFHGTVTGLLYDEHANRTTGVNVNLPSGETVELTGALVVDATGSSMGGFRWLKAIPKVFDSCVPSFQDLKVSYDPKISYTTCELALSPKLEQVFRNYGFPSGSDTNSEIYVSLPIDDEKHLIIEKREKNYLYVVCGGYNWHKRINSMSDFEEFLKELNPRKKFPDWLNEMPNTIQSEDIPVSYVYSKYPPSVYIKYHEAATHLPTNFIVVGDALSQTNPANGQGCSKACAHAIILNSQLHRATGLLPHSFSKDYFLEAKDRTEHIWTSLKNSDYDHPSTIPIPGENIQTTARLSRAYGSILVRLAIKDADVSGALIRNAGWLDPPTMMMAPWLIRRAAWAWVRQTLGFGI